MLEKVEITQLTQSIDQLVSKIQPASETNKDQVNIALLTSIQKFGPALVEALKNAKSDINDKYMQAAPHFDDFLNDTRPLLNMFNEFLNMQLENSVEKNHSAEQLMIEIQKYSEKYKTKDSGSWNRLKAIAVLLADALFALLVFILVFIVMAIIIVPFTFFGAAMGFIGPALREASAILQIVFEVFNDHVKGRVGLAYQDSLWDLTIHGHSAMPMNAINIAANANSFFSGFEAQPLSTDINKEHGVGELSPV